jgi:hypothetical protein
LLLVILILPIHLATRPLLPGERREGGRGWNLCRSFAITWTLLMAIWVMTWLIGVATATTGVNSDAARAGSAIGLAIGMAFLGMVWFFPTAALLVVGLLIRKPQEVEVGLAVSSLTDGAPSSAGETVTVVPKKSPLQAALVVGALVAVGVIIQLSLSGELGSAFPASPQRRAPTAITMDKFERLQDGMSYSEVKAILGQPGEQLSSSSLGGSTTVMYQWRAEEGFGNMNAMFQDDKMISKSQYGLK